MEQELYDAGMNRVTDTCIPEDVARAPPRDPPPAPRRDPPPAPPNRSFRFLPIPASCAPAGAATRPARPPHTVSRGTARPARPRISKTQQAAPALPLPRLGACERLSPGLLRLAVLCFFSPGQAFRRVEHALVDLYNEAEVTTALWTNFAIE